MRNLSIWSSGVIKGLAIIIDHLLGYFERIDFTNGGVVWNFCREGKVFINGEVNFDACGIYVKWLFGDRIRIIFLNFESIGLVLCFVDCVLYCLAEKQELHCIGSCVGYLKTIVFECCIWRTILSINFLRHQDPIKSPCTGILLIIA